MSFFNLLTCYRVLIGWLLCAALQATPLNNAYDTQPLYSCKTSDKFFKEREEGEISFSIAPFYQHANTARDAAGKKVPGGDRLGQINMFGLFFDTNRAPKTFNAGNYPKAWPARDAVQVVVNQALTPGDQYRLGLDSTDKQNFVATDNKFAYVSSPLSYEKIGLRSQLNCDFGFGLGVSARMGVVDVKVKQRPVQLEKTFAADLVLRSIEGYEPNDASKDDSKALYKALFSDQAREAVANDYGLTFKQFHQSSPEDMHLQVYWHAPIDFYEKNDEVGVTLVPYLALGAWMPLSEELDKKYVFAAPFGNQDRDFGFTVEGALGLEFPVLPQAGGQSFGVSIGGGLLIFNEKDLASQYLPTTDLQSVVFPWQVTRLTKRPGETWYVNVGMKAEHFLENLSFYADFSYTQHVKDTFTIKETDSARRDAFAAGVDGYQRSTAWKNQQVSAGFNFEITDSVALSAAAQAHISGTQVMRSVTLLGGLAVTF